jgi:hypothetical protein
MTIRSNRIGTDSSQCNWTCQSVSANQDSNDFEDNVVRLRYDINHITSEEKLMNWEQDNHVTDTSEVSRHWTVARNKVRLTIPVEFVTAGKPIMWNRISASSWHDNFWEVRDSSKREGLQWVMRDHIQYNRFQCDTFVIINLSGGSTRFFMHGSGNGMYPTPGGNVFNQCVFWSNMDLAGAPPFFFESAIFSGDSISRCLFQGSANTSILAVDGLKFGTAAIYRNTIVNMGNGPAFETAKNSDTSNPCGWDTTDSLSVKGNIFYSPRNTPFTMAFPANGQGRVRSDCNVFGDLP